MSLYIHSACPMHVTRFGGRSPWGSGLWNAPRHRLLKVSPHCSFPTPRVRREKPVDDQAYSLLVGLHRYQPSPLDSRVERTDDSSPYWTRQTVSFKAAYANDRVLAHLFLPKNAVPPYEVIAVLGGSFILDAKRVEDFGFPYEFLIRSGRAVIIPAYWGTLERGPSEHSL